MKKSFSVIILVSVIVYVVADLLSIYKVSKTSHTYTETNNSGMYQESDFLDDNIIENSDYVNSNDDVQDYDDEIVETNLFLPPKNKSAQRMVEIHLGSPAELLIRDSEGNEVGYVDGEGVVTEIPGGSYDQENFINTIGNSKNPHKEKVLMLLDPADDVYTLEVIGTGDGDYSLTIVTVDENGEILKQTFFGIAIAGEKDVYVVDLTTSSFDWDGWIEDVLVAGSGLSEEWQRFLENKLRVIAMQLERENSVAVDAIVAGLVTKLHNSDEIGVEDVIEILEGGV